MPPRKKSVDASLHNIPCAPAVEDPLAPPSADRQAEWERILQLKPGELAPARVQLRKQLLEHEEYLALKAVLAQDESQQPAPARPGQVRSQTGGRGGHGPGEV